MENRITISSIIILLCLSNNLFAQNTGDYRSQSSGNWSVAANWQKYNGSEWLAAPSAPITTDGVITIADGHSIIVASETTIDQLVVAMGATLTVNSGIALKVANGIGDDITVHGTLELAGNLSPGTSGETIVINGTMNWSNNSSTTFSEITTNSLSINPSGTLNISGSEAKAFRYSGGSIYNSGTTNWTGIGPIRGGSNHFVNQLSGVFIAQNDAAIYYDNLGGGGITFDNAGTFRKSVGSGTTTFSNTIFNNTGTVEVQSGTLSLGYGGTHTGSFSISSGKILNFSSGNHSVGENVTFSGEGTFLADNGAAVNFEGLTNGASISSATTFNFSGGSLGGSGKLTVNGTMIWSSTGDLAITSLIISSGAYLNIGGSATTNFTGKIYNSGTATWTGSFNIRGGGAVFNNLSGGIFEAQNDQALYYNSGGGGAIIFNNAGTFRKSVGNGTTTFLSATFNNTGTVDVQSGILSLQYGGTHTGSFAIASGKTLNFSDIHSIGENATFTGAGTVLASIGLIFTGTTIGATVSSATTFNFSGGSLGGGPGDAGKLTINGTMNWTSTGNLATIVTIASGGVLNIPGSSNKILRYGKIYNSGLINLSGTGSIGTEVGTIQNNSDGIFDIQTDAGIYRHGSGTQSFINNGILKKSAGSGVSTLLDISGSFSNAGTIKVDAGTLYIVSGISNFSSGTLTGGTYDVTGILKFTSASITTNAASIVLNGSSSQIVNQSDVDALASFTTNRFGASFTLTNGRNFSTIATTFTNNGTVNFGANVFSGSGNFTTTSASTLIIGSPEGITTSGTLGNVQSSGARTFSTAANYTYNGTSAQATGNGLPSQVNSFTMNNSSGLTLTLNVIAAETFTLSSGNINTGSNLITVGTSATSLGSVLRTSGTIVGNFKRWVATATVNDVVFPIGTSTNFRPANISFTTAPTSGGTISAFFTASNPGSTGLPLNDGGSSISTVGIDGYWTLGSGNGLSGGTYNLDLSADGFSGINNYTFLHMLQRTNNSSNWSAEGNHSVCTGSNSSPIIHRTGLTVFSEYGVSSTSDNPLPVELKSFTVSLVGSNVQLEWSTATEVNNNKFEIEKSTVGADHQSLAWNNVGEVLGHGNSNSSNNYSFIDNNCKSGKYLYRLKQIDNDGKFTYSSEIEAEITIPVEFNLSQNYPNPFNPSTTISYQIPLSNVVRLIIYDILGKEIAVLVNEKQGAGNYIVQFDANTLTSGIYIASLKAGNFVKAIKMHLVK